MKPVKLVSVSDASDLARMFKERAHKDPAAVAARKVWGKRVVQQVVTGLNRFAHERKLPVVY